MADTESILRLGIEAARSGDKDEARNMFRLLTRQDSDNPQAWLWLAGVAADNDEKRAALERVLELDPYNEMAAVGLQALGGPSARQAPPPEPEPMETQPFTMDSFDDFDFEDSTPAPAPAPAAPARPSTPSYDDPDLDFASSLDSIGMYENYAKAEAGGSSGSSGSARSTTDANNYSIPDFGDDDDEMDLAAYMNRPRVSAADIELEEEEEEEAPRRKFPFLPLIALALILGAIVFGLMQLLNDDPDPTAGNPTARPTTEASGGTAEPGTDPTVDPNVNPLPTQDPNNPLPTQDPNNPLPTQDPNNPLPTADAGPQPTQPPFNPGGLAGANPSQVPPGTTLQAGDWVYNFPTSQYAGLLSPAQVGGNEPGANGRWLLVLMIVNNASGQEQPLPDDAFVIKDSQGGIYLPSKDASEIYLNQAGRGLAADFSHKDALPVGIDVSVPLIYQVGVGATDLTLFSPQNPNEGYVVVQQVP